MKRHKIIVSLALLLALILAVTSLAGCNLGEIYDDDQEIAKPSSRYSASIMKAKTTSDMVAATFSLTASAKNFSGVDNIGDIEVKNGVLVLTYSCKVTEGRFKVVAVKDGEVSLIFEGKGTETGFSFDLPNGKYRLKIVGDQADFELKLTLVGIAIK